MSFIQAKCSNCGANLHIDSDQSDAICSFCGTTYIRETPNITNNISAGVVNIINSKEDQNTSIYLNEHYVYDSSLDKEQIEKLLLCLLLSDDNAPLDIPIKLNITKIQKEFFPYYDIDLERRAEWSAVSIWEEEREVPDISYDSEGNKQVDSHWETVIINEQQTHGKIEPQHYYEKIWIGPYKYKNAICNWINKYINNSPTHVNKDFFKDKIIVTGYTSFEEALEEAERIADEHMESWANVPGDRYEDFEVYGETISSEFSSCYLGTYHIFYEYEGNEYDCFIPGIANDNDICGAKPVEYVTQLYLYGLKDKSIKTKKKRTKYLVLLIISLILLACSIGLIFINLLFIIAAVVFLWSSLLLFFIFVTWAIKHANDYTELDKYEKRTASIKNSIKDSINNGTIQNDNTKHSLEKLIKSRNNIMNDGLSSFDKETIKLRKEIATIKAKSYNTEEDIRTTVDNMSKEIFSLLNKNPDSVSSFSFYKLTVDFCLALESFADRTQSSSIRLYLYQLAKKHADFLLKGKEVNPSVKNHMSKACKHYDYNIEMIQRK